MGINYDAMDGQNPIDTDFLSHVTAVIERNMSNEQFGVSELAEEMSMSRSNLLRRLKKQSDLSVNQLIRELRLKRGMEMLKTTSLNVSEVSHQVGFGSTSYFIKVFRERYGYPPGEANERKEESIPAPEKPRRSSAREVAFVVALLAGIIVAVWYAFSAQKPQLEKSIIVLPFKNDSGDSTNIYLINGLMESTLNNLQSIKDLRVVSRTTSEKYRSTDKSIPELARELNVNYVVEGSGQKVGDQILLNIQLIEGPSDRHLWSGVYKREVKDIFELQQEIAKVIAREIEAVITPEEAKTIEKVPTKNLEAYDLYLKGNDQMYAMDIEKAAGFYKQAIALDKEFAAAYSEAVLAYYYLDVFVAEKKYFTEISEYSDNAMLYDPQAAQSLVAKALYYMHKGDRELAVPFLEKALEYNPNSSLAINFLSDLYNSYIPNTSKYLEYALRGLRIDFAAKDSGDAALKYLHVANALIQAGFVDEAMKNINRSLDYLPNNSYAIWVKAYITFVKNRKPEEVKKMLLDELKRDSTQLHIVQEVANIYFYEGDYETAYRYFDAFTKVRDAYQLDIFWQSNLEIGIVMEKMGQHDRAKRFIQNFKEMADKDRTIYKDMYLMHYWVHEGDIPKAIGYLRAFSQQNEFQYRVLLLPEDPTLASIKDLPEFNAVMAELERKFLNRKGKLKQKLEEEGLWREVVGGR